MIKKITALLLSATLAMTTMMSFGENIHFSIFKHSTVKANAMEILDSINLDDLDSEPVIEYHPDISKLATVTLSGNTFNYTGKAICPTVTVKRNYRNTRMTEGKQYTVTYQNNINPGTATVIVKGAGQYIGTITTTFKIKTPPAPAVVSGLKAVAVSANAIKLGWNKNSVVNGYIIYQKKGSASWARLAKTTTNTDTYMVTKLTPGTNYQYRILAYITAGKEITSSTFLPAITVTTRPANVTGFRAASQSSTTVNLAWSKSTGAQSYVVYQAVSGKWTSIGKTTGTTFKVTKLSPNKAYRFAVRAYRKGADGKALASPTFPTLTTATGPAYANFTATAGAKKAVLKWNKAAGATGYIVYYKTSAAASWQKLAVTKSTAYVKTGLVTGRTYYFTVKAYRTLNGKNYSASFLTKSVKVK